MESLSNHPPASILNDEHLDNLLHHQNEGKKQLLTLFVENALECLCVLERSINQDDCELWLMATGELGSLAQVLGADFFAQTVFDAKSYSDHPLSERKQQLAIIRSEFERVRFHIRVLCK
jgi:hypothetical protein